jgi:hypothetical protein
MLDRSENTLLACSDQPPSVRVISGRQLKRELRKASPTKKAMLAADQVAGRLIIEGCTRTQARASTGASTQYLAAACSLSPLERQQVAYGALTLAEVCRRRRDVTEEQLDQLVAKIGAGPLSAALCRAFRLAMAAE